MEQEPGAIPVEQAATNPVSAMEQEPGAIPVEQAATNPVSAMEQEPGAIPVEQAATNPVSAMEQEPVPSKYQVFINHRGTDVKKTLASLIYHRLIYHGLTVFLDNKELHAGDTLSPAIQGAIQSASVNITIFSRRYAESRWCLDELCWILECKQRTKIIPVFYDVQPSDLSHIESGPYAKAFKYHTVQGRDIKKWKTALNEASSCIVGTIKTNASDDLGLLLEIIVKAVRTEIYKCEALEETPVPLVGMGQAVKDLENAMTRIKSNDIAIVGIAGMAGVGKSTLVEHYYMSKRLDYSKFCFLRDIGKSKDICTLQRQLLSDLLSYNNDTHHDDTSKGKSLLRNGLKLSRVLIVFDDVHKAEQVNNLLDIHAVGRDSLILITSCDQEVLRRCCRGVLPRPSQTTKTVLHKVKPLQEKDALELFCLYAFNQNEPHDGFRDLVVDVLKICGGLPLSLKLLGVELSYISDKKSRMSKLKTWSRTPPYIIIGELKVRYEHLKLNPEEKSIFLDIGCFFVGEDKDLSVRVLEGFDYAKPFDYDDVCDCLESLRKKCLVEYHDDVESRNDHSDNPNRSSLEGREKITMHNQTRELARHIVGEELHGSPTSKPIRLSCSAHTQKMLQLEGEAASCRIRGNEILPAYCRNKIKGVGVRLFVIENRINLSEFFGLVDMEGGLVWLRLCKVISISFPSTISLTKLRVLELEGLHGDVEQLLNRFIDPPSELRELSIKVTDTLPCTSTSRKPFDLENTDKNITDSALQAETATSSSLFRFLKWIGTSMTLLNKIELKNIPSLQSPRIFMLGKIELEKLPSLPSLGINFSELKDLSYLDISGSQTVETLL